MIDFESLGYEDITKNNPIRFMECFGATFSTLYPYEKRFYKKEDDIVIILKVGNNNSIVDISGICCHSKGWHKFEVHTHSDYASEFFEQTLKAVKYKIHNL